MVYERAFEFNHYVHVMVFSGVARILDRGGSSSHAAKGGISRVAASVGGSGGMLRQKIFDILDALR